MIKTYDLACHGLLVGSPVDQLAAYLNANTPAGFHLDIVGGLDPRPQTGQIIDNMIAKGRAGFPSIFIGHSLGAMLSFYAADALNAQKLSAPLIASIDPTCWGTNSPGIPSWSEVVLPPNTGRYFVPSNVDVWVHCQQDSFPGGGSAVRAPGNDRTRLVSLHLPAENHLSIVNCAQVRSTLLAEIERALAS